MREWWQGEWLGQVHHQARWVQVVAANEDPTRRLLMNPPISRGQLWAIVLAAGEGARLAALTRNVHGSEVPKKFASLFGGQTFLQQTLERIAPLVPSHRTVVVVADDRIDLATDQTRCFPGVEIVAQPRNRGTAAGVLFPLLHVLARDPEARVLVFPSDHHFRRESVFVAAARRAVRAAAAAPARVTLLGAVADSPATDLGWIVAGRGWGPAMAQARRVEHFVEKPDPARAVDLLRRGGLGNTLVLAARGRALWNLARRHVPNVVDDLTPYTARIGQADGRARLAEIYDRIPAADLSRDILQPASGLTVVPMLDAGWSDCGTPERLLQALHGTDHLPCLLAKVTRPPAMPDQVSDGRQITT
jgi:mannose-1-phosphate guanylyltransferase